MKQPNISPDDPKLTAFALGELDAQESAQVAAAIENNIAAKAAVAEIRSLAEQLEKALENEPILPVPAARAPEIIRAPAAAATAGKVVRFPIYWISGLAAACVAVALVSHQRAGSSATQSSLAMNTAAPTTVVASAEVKTSAPAAEVNRVAEPTETAPSVAPAIRPEQLETASMRKRVLQPDAKSDVQPSMLREDGLKVGRTVADATDTKASTSRSGEITTPSSQPGMSVASANGSISAQFTPVTAAPADKSESHSAIPAALAYNRATYAYQPATGFLGVSGYPLSLIAPTSSTLSYASVRESLQNGRLPAPDAVRVEEMLNYFSYTQSAPRDGNALAASLEVAAAPWNPSHRLVRIGVKGNELNVPSGPAMVAKDVRLEVEFNPEQAKSYRLIGYENRPVKPSATTVAKIDGSEVDAGTVVTVLYEVVPVNEVEAARGGETLKYDAADAKRVASDDPRFRELLTAKIRYKIPTVDVSRTMELPLIDTGKAFSVASNDFKMAAAVAQFGMLLKEQPKKNNPAYDELLSWTPEAKDSKEAADKHTEFIDLVKQAKTAPVE